MPIKAGFRELQRFVAVVRDSDGNRPYCQAFANQRLSRRPIVAVEVPLNFRREPERLFGAHRERQSPGDRKPDLDLPAHQIGWQDALPVEQR